jgi:ectoine hydroxylase-related dioxygenase (phytanoyl-CoA dioxygenase family)
MDEQLTDYLFDLNGYLILENAIATTDLAAMNQWVDDHWDYVITPKDADGRSRWIGRIETQSYGGQDGVNFQNIVDGGTVFEKLIDYPAWIHLVRKYIAPNNGLSIHENFLNVRGKGGHLYIHSGGHFPRQYFTFRHHNTSEWMVGQINVLIALEDIGLGDGGTVLIPGSHKVTETHPRLQVDGEKVGSLNDGLLAQTAIGMQEIHLKAGDVLFFTDAVTHGSSERINDGYRRSVVYRYSPKHIRTRFNIEQSDDLLNKLTPERRQILDPIPIRRP